MEVPTLVRPIMIPTIKITTKDIVAAAIKVQMVIVQVRAPIMEAKEVPFMVVLDIIRVNMAHQATVHQGIIRASNPILIKAVLDPVPASILTEITNTINLKEILNIWTLRRMF